MLVFASVRGPADALPFEDRAVFTLDNFVGAVTQRNVLRVLRDTSLYVGSAVAVAFVVGFVLAWLVERTDIPLRGVLFVLVIVPFLLPPSTLLETWQGLTLPRTGEVNIFLRQVLGLQGVGPINPFSLTMMVFAQGLMLTPLVFLLMAATLRNFNGALEEASRASGADGWHTLRRITLPLLFPAAFTAVALSIWLTLDSTVVPFTFGAAGRFALLNFRIFAVMNNAAGGLPDFGLGAAFAVVTILVLGGIFLVYAYTTRNAARYAMLTGAVTRPPRFRLGPWLLPALLLVGLYLLVMWGLPAYQLVKGSLRAGLSGYGAVLTSGRFWEGTRNTAVMAGGSATLGTAVVVLVSWVVVRSRSGWVRSSLDLLATSSLVVPALLAAVAFLLVFLTLKDLHLYGTLLGVTLALSYRLAIPYRLSNAAMRQVGRDMEEASAASGATPLDTLRRVTMPLLAPAIAVSWAIFFVFGIREFTLVRFLGFGAPTVNNVGGAFGRTPGAGAAASVLVIVMVLGTVLAVRYLLLRRARLL